MKLPSFVTAAKAILTTTAIAATALLASCSSKPPAQVGEALSPQEVARIERPDLVQTTPDATSTARTIDDYKRDIAQRISQVNSTRIYPGQPQALLRSVVVLRFSVDGSGKLLKSEILRSNRDSVTEATALSSLRNTAPFPKPASGLLRNGRVELSETWLFNNDGRFQIRSVAQTQMDR